MSCRDAYETNNVNKFTQLATETPKNKEERLLFGADFNVKANTVLQNNITEFDWVVTNKIYPNFCGRNITGENCLTKEEIEFLHSKGCKIAVTHAENSFKETEEQGKLLAKKLAIAALELGIPEATAIFLEIAEDANVTTEFMKGYAQGLISLGYIPGFKANTDANYGFDREFSRGMQFDKELFANCLIWAVTPSLKEYDQMTTTHLIHPDNWAPFAPSGITRNDIAIWQYGKNCHPILDDAGNETSFNLNLVKNENVIIGRMF